MSAPAHQDMTRAIAHAANQMWQPSSVEEVLNLIVASAAETLPAFDHIGVSTVTSRGEIVNRAATSELVHVLDRVQYDILEGPCVDSLQGEDVVVASNIRHDQRWPRYVPQAVRYGLRSQLAVRLHLADRGTTGGLNLYSTKFEQVSDEAVTAAGFFAIHASVALGQVTRAATLADAIESRQAIGQAIGILMERYKIDEKAAHAFLWRASSHGNVKVRDLAAQLIDEANSGGHGGR